MARSGPLGGRTAAGERLRLLLLAALLVSGCSGGTTGPPTGVLSLAAVEIAGGLAAPVHLTAPAGDPRLFLVEQAGRIRVLKDGLLLAQPFLDITPRVGAGGERGLLSMAFDPDYAVTGFFWVNFTDRDGATRIERYRVSANPDVADPSSAADVLHVAQPFANHNGGQIAFGPDGMLYIGMGDGGSGGDPLNHGQSTATLLGALLRVDVRATPYAIPPDNPFRNTTSARPEIWGWGLRNPWRFSFDRGAPILYIADVGQSAWEEINAVPAGTAGLNFGWNVMEGSRCFGAGSCNPSGLTAPVHEYSHAEGCSVTGGYVYRGARMPALHGTYFYSDYCAGWLRSFRLSGGVASEHATWDVGTLGNVLSFGEDAVGELYVLTAAGRVYRLEPR